jgi:hypothetical protein
MFNLKAFWFTEEKGVEGPVFGSNDYWKGLGIFLDSFDNDLQVIIDRFKFKCLNNNSNFSKTIHTY